MKIQRKIRYSTKILASRFLPNQALIEMGRNELLLEIVEKDYCDYTGHVLEQYFRQKFREEERVTAVGRYWDRKGNIEIDVIALNDLDKTAIVAEVKRNPEKFDRRELENKYATIKREFGRYTDVRLIGLSMITM